MTEAEAHKINDLYKQIDTLTAENKALKAATTNNADEHKVLLDHLDERLDEVVSLVNEVSCKCGEKISCSN